MSRIQVITSLISDTCCICLERKDIVYKCIQCNEAKLCGECYKEMREYTLRRTRCPTCRKTSWVVEIPNLYIHTQAKNTNRLTCGDHINNTIFLYKDDCTKITKKYCGYSCVIVVGSYLYGYILFNMYDYCYDTSVEITQVSYMLIGSLGAITTFLLLFLLNKCVLFTIIKPFKRYLGTPSIEPDKETDFQTQTHTQITEFRENRENRENTSV
jgi:hypothetical protein